METTVAAPAKRRRGWPCPECMGLGLVLGGGYDKSPEGFRVIARRECLVCKGRGRVMCHPLPDGEGPDDGG